MSAPERNGDQAESRPSVKLIRNAAGITQIEVKAYADDLAGAQEQAQAVYDDLCATYDAPAPKVAR